MDHDVDEAADDETQEGAVCIEPARRQIPEADHDERDPALAAAQRLVSARRLVERARARQQRARKGPFARLVLRRRRGLFLAFALLCGGLGTLLETSVRRTAGFCTTIHAQFVGNCRASR
jgi:hypothetical protein